MNPLESGHASVNGIDMYYEVHGRTDGTPLVLLHGGHGDYLGEVVATQEDTQYPALTVQLIGEFLGTN